MKDCRTPMSCCDPHCCCDIIHKPTDTVTAVLNGQPIAITGEAATVIKERDAEIDDLTMYLQCAIDMHIVDRVIRDGIDPPKTMEAWAVGAQQFLAKHSKGEDQ